MQQFGKGRVLGPVLALLAVLAVGVGQARATIIPSFVSATSNGNGTFTYNYTANLGADATVQSGDFLTIFDYQGLQGTPTVTGSSTGQTADWTVSVQNIGLTPVNTAPTDNPTIPNFSIKYAGTANIVGPTSNLLTFAAVSTNPSGGTNLFGSQDHLSSGPIGLIGSVVSGAPQIGVPEPTSLVLLGLGLPLAALMRRRPRRAD